jgi:hypothetical protein
VKTIYRRLQRLEEPLRLAQQECRVYGVRYHNQELALDRDSCIQILRECGYVPTSRYAVAHFTKIPDGLNAKEIERFLRERGAELFRGHLR